MKRRAHSKGRAVDRSRDHIPVGVTPTKDPWDKRSIVDYRAAEWLLAAIAVSSLLFGMASISKEGGGFSWSQAAGLATLYLNSLLAVSLLRRSIGNDKQQFSALDKRIADFGATMVKELNDNEDLLVSISYALRRATSDNELPQILNRVATSYSVLHTERDLKLAKQARRVLEGLQETLLHREYEIDWNNITEYPVPFYEDARKTIDATNIGPISDGFMRVALSGDKRALVELNRAAVERGVVVRRIFIWKFNEVADEAKSLMRAFVDAGVQCRQIDTEKAEIIAREVASGAIKKLHDFTLFDGGGDGLRYSGRLEERGQERGQDLKVRKMIITSNPETNLALSAQFEAIWQNAKDWDDEALIE